MRASSVQARSTPGEAGGAAVDESGLPIAGLFVTGWMKRGAAGLIGAARPDARQTVETMLHQLDSAYERRAGHGRIAEVLGAALGGEGPGTVLACSALARRYLDLGCTFVATGVDILVFANAARKLAASFIGSAPEAPKAPGAAY